MVRKTKELVKVCLHSSQTVQISFQFDEYFDKKFQNSNLHRFKIFTKTCLDTLYIVYASEASKSKHFYI